MANIILRYFYTIRYLKPDQIFYQFWYRSRFFVRKLTGFSYPIFVKKEGEPLILSGYLPKNNSFENGEFTFLNLKKKYHFKNNGIEELPEIDWSEKEYGKLWAYNLNYMDYLLQPDFSDKTGCELIMHFIKNISKNKVGLEPYPTAIRTINWIKFISNPAFRYQSDEHRIFKRELDGLLYAQYNILLDNLEYHIKGNHLLEDGFSLLFGAFYFNDRKLYYTAEKIIVKELEEQILRDGAHFELSPMYHQIILDRLLDCINLIKNNEKFPEQESFLEFLRVKASKMIKWINCMTFQNGDIPFVNDSASGIAPSTQQLNDYFREMGLQTESDSGYFLTESGYRKILKAKYECLIDIGSIGPDYQPGHAHADTLNFILYVNNTPSIIDSGICTYEDNELRKHNKGTSAHNTVTVDNANSSDVWSSFRVGKRARVKVIKDEKNEYAAKHNGFSKAIHHREWKFSEGHIEIIDLLSNKNSEGIAHFHFSPGVFYDLIDNQVTLLGSVLRFENAYEIKPIKINIPHGFNILTETYKIEVFFKQYLKTTIVL